MVFAFDGTDAVLVDYQDYHCGKHDSHAHPPHPGEVLREYLGDITITKEAVKLGVNRVTLKRVVSGASGISADMAYRLGQAIGARAEMWAGMQMQYELHQASKIKRPKIERLAA